MSKHALTVCYGGGHVRMMIPVVRQLQARGWRVTCLGLTAAGPALARSGLPNLGFRDFVRPGDEGMLAEGQRLAQTMHNPDLGIPFEESVAYLGLSYGDLVRRVGAVQAAAEFEAKGRHAFLPLTILERVLDSVRPDIVVTTNSPKSERAAIMVARQRGTPTVTMVDLFGEHERYPLAADSICVFSSITARNLARGGVAESTIVVTGNPAFDEIETFRAMDAAAWARENLRLAAGEKCALLADVHGYGLSDRVHLRTDDEIRSNLDLLYSACRTLDVKLLVRPHPNQRKRTVAQWAAAKPGRAAQLVDDLPLYPLVMAAGVVATMASTVGLEAALLSRPVIELQEGAQAPYPNIALYGLAEAAGPQQLLDTMRRLLFDEDAIRGLRQRQGSLLRQDGCAAVRVADVIEAALASRAQANSAANS